MSLIKPSDTSNHYKEYLIRLMDEVQGILPSDFQTHTYGSSVRYSRTIGKTVEELSVRLMENAKIQVEHTFIRSTPLGRKVKSESKVGPSSHCLDFIKAKLALQG